MTPAAETDLRRLRECAEAALLALGRIERLLKEMAPVPSGPPYYTAPSLLKPPQPFGQPSTLDEGPPAFTPPERGEPA